MYIVQDIVDIPLIGSQPPEMPVTTCSTVCIWGLKTIAFQFISLL